MLSKNLARFVIFLVFAALVTSTVTAINVTLEGPADSKLFLNSNDVNFNCSATTDFGITNVSLYHDINGSFVLNQTERFGGELDPNELPGNVLLMHFNNESSIGENDSFVNDSSGNGNTGDVSGATFNATGGWFNGAFEFDGNDLINISDSDSLDLTTVGTIELWFKLNQTSTWNPILVKGIGNDDTFNPYAIWMEYSSGIRRLRFHVGDGFEGLKRYGHITGFDLGRWYHFAVTWNSSHVVLYLDGTLQTIEATGITPFSNNDPIRIGFGERSSTSYYFNGTVDELAIYNRTLSAAEIQNHLGAYPASANASWNLTGIVDNNYRWNCLAYDNATNSNFSISNYTFEVDFVPPLFGIVKTAPDDTDDLDPGVVVNITANVSDINNISTVILQYKSPSATQFTNVTMSNGTEDLSNTTFNASFTASVNGNWTYRIFANTTNNQANTSSETNVSVEFDYTWNATRSFGVVTGNLLETKNIGNITINNTGDFDLNFDLSDNSPNGVTYNITEPFQLAPGGRVTISAETTFSGSVRDDYIAITIDATTPQANPSSLTANATLVTTSGGAYLFNTLVSFPTAVNQSDSINLSGNVRNIGNETALDTNLSWVLLGSGWINDSGNLTQQIGSLAEDSTEINNVTINVSSSVSVGSYTIYLNSTCSNNVTGCSDSESFSITVSCSNTDAVCGEGCTYLTDTDCTQEVVTVTSGSGGGGSSAGGSSIEILVKPEKINISQTVELVRGETDNFTINVTNTFENSVLENLTLRVTGFPLQYLITTPDLITNLGYLQTKTFTVTVASPVYKGYEEHVLNATVTGQLIKSFTLDDNATATSTNPYTLKNFISLIIHEISKEEADVSLEESTKNLEEMQEAGFPVKKSVKLLEEAKEKLDIGRYKLAKDLSEQIAKIRRDAFSANALIKDVESKIEEAENNGLLIIETKKLLNLAVAAFEREDFEVAIQRAEDAQLSAIIETKGKINVVKFLQQYWQALLIAFAVVVISGYILRKKIEVITITRRLEDLEKEVVSINQLMEEVQTKTFKDKTMSTTEYHKLMYQYENRLSEIGQLQTKLRSKKVGLVRITDEINRLKRENEALIESSKNIQDAYYNKGTLSKKKYERLASEYKLRRIEIEKAIAMLEAKQAKKEKLEKLEGIPEKVSAKPEPKHAVKPKHHSGVFGKPRSHSKENILKKLKEVYHHDQR